MVFIPILISLVLITRVKYPETERVTSGVSYWGMFRHTFTRPGFYLFAGLMFISAASELVPGSWIDLILSSVVGIQGFWLVAFIYTVHGITRLSTGFLDRRIGTSGILLMGSVFTLIGLYLLSQATNPLSGMLAGLIFGMGTCVLWPTTLANVSQRYPKGGTLAIGVTASAGMLSTYALMPIFGRLFDQAKVRAAGGAEAFENLVEGSAAHEQVMTTAAASIFQTSVWLPCMLVAVFSLVCVYDWRSRRKG